MNEKTFNELFPEAQLSVCPHEIPNFRNSVADISILGQFSTYLEFRGEKYSLKTLIDSFCETPSCQHGLHADAFLFLIMVIKMSEMSYILSLGI